MMLRRLVQGAFITASTCLLLAATADAQHLNPVNIDSVSVLPGELVPPFFPVSLDVFLRSGSASIGFYAPTQVQISGNDILVDLYAQSGFLTILDERHEIVELGGFAPGSYSYLVRQNGPTVGPPQVGGTFRVIPEPASAMLAAVAMATTSARVRRRR